MAAVAAILLSCKLGVIVSLSTFLTIGATSSLSYNVIGHVKTVSNLVGGYLLFGDTFMLAQLFGVALALAGIGWGCTETMRCSLHMGQCSFAWPFDMPMEPCN